MIPFDSKSGIYIVHGLCWVFLDRKLGMRPGLDFLYLFKSRFCFKVILNPFRDDFRFRINGIRL